MNKIFYGTWDSSRFENPDILVELNIIIRTSKTMLRALKWVTKWVLANKKEPESLDSAALFRGRGDWI